MSTSTNDPHAPLAGVRVMSLALNLPGPAALMRCRQMGATCTKLEPPPPAGLCSGVSSGTAAGLPPGSAGACHTPAGGASGGSGGATVTVAW